MIIVKPAGIRRMILGAVIASTLAHAAPAIAAKRVPDRPSIVKPSRTYAPDRAIVGISPGERSEAATTITEEGGDVVDYSRAGSYFVVETSSDSAQWADVVEGDDSIRYAEPDWEVTAADIAPSDPSWDKLWGLHQVEASAAWHRSTGASDVVVGVLDTGVDYAHEDLASQLWVNPNEDPATPADDDRNGWTNDIHGIDCANNDADPADDHGHGTHVAGTIGAAANNHKGIAGTAWNVKIMALKFLGADATGYTSDAIECLHYAINNGAHITNNSWGGARFSQSLYEVIKLAAAQDQLFIAAAMNDGMDTTTNPIYPASYEVDNVISVAATDVNDDLATFSNYGATSVDLAAPGVAILSTVPDGYATMSGTSMATPHVTGAAVLLLGADVSLRVDAPRLRSAILDNVDHVPSLAGKVVTGGRLNIARALWPDRPASLHVGDMTSSSQSVSKQHWMGTVTISVVGDNATSVPGAHVNVAWGTGKRASCETGADGTCSVSMKLSKKTTSKVRAGVTSVVHSEVPYKPSDNQEFGPVTLVWST